MSVWSDRGFIFQHPEKKLNTGLESLSSGLMSERHFSLSPERRRRRLFGFWSASVRGPICVSGVASTRGTGRSTRGGAADHFISAVSIRAESITVCLELGADTFAACILGTPTLSWNANHFIPAGCQQRESMENKHTCVL